MNRRQVAARAAIRALTMKHGTYQPVRVGGRIISGGLRGTDQRFDAMLPVLRGSDVRTVVDHGCSEGYIVRRCAEAGMFALGLEQARRPLLVGHLSMLADELQGWGLGRTRLDVDNVAGLPEFDATVSLSVMHHTMSMHGLEYASRMLSRIRERTRKVLVIETGQSNETAFAWSSRLPDMGSDPHEWIAHWVESCGFRDPQVICKVPSFNSDVRRATFVAYRDAR